MEAQQKLALDVLENAELVVIPTTVLMETVWVLSHSYKISKVVILDLLTDFINSVPNISVHEKEVSAGFALMKQNGDFADGIHHYLGSQAGADVFISFDKKAIKLLQKQDFRVKILE